MCFTLWQVNTKWVFDNTNKMKGEMYKTLCIWVYKHSLATSLYRDISTKEWSKILKKMVAIASDGPSPHTPFLRLDLTVPPNRHGGVPTPSPCWALHFMTQERLMFWNPTPSEPRLSPAATISAKTPCKISPTWWVKLSFSPCGHFHPQWVKIAQLFVHYAIWQFLPACWVKKGGWENW